MNSLTDSFLTLLMMSIIGWTTIHGVVGGAIAKMNNEHPAKGFLISAFIPIPFVGWYVTYAVTSSNYK